MRWQTDLFLKNSNAKSEPQRGHKALDGWSDEVAFSGSTGVTWVVSTGFRVPSRFLERMMEVLHYATGDTFYLYSLAGHERGNLLEYCYSDSSTYYNKLKEVVSKAVERNQGPVNVIGHSLAGLMFLRIAQEHPELIKRMILLAPAIDLGNSLYLTGLWIVRAFYYFLGRDSTPLGRALRLWQITPPYEWNSRYLRLIGRLLVRLRIMPPYVWDSNDVRHGYVIWSIIDWLFRGERTSLGRGLRRFQGTSPNLHRTYLARFLAQFLVAVRLMPYSDWVPPRFGTEYRLFRSIVRFWMEWDPEIAHAMIAYQKQEPSSRSSFMARLWHKFLIRRRILPHSSFETSAELYQVCRLEFPRVPLVSASSIPPFQEETLRGLRRISCPVLIVHGTHDTVIPYSEAMWLNDMLTDLGVDSGLAAISGGGHSFFLNTQHALETQEIVVRWMKRDC